MTKKPINDKDKSKLNGVWHLPTQFYVHKKIPHFFIIQVHIRMGENNPLELHAGKGIIHFYLKNWPVVWRLDGAIQQINYYPVEKCSLLDSDLSDLSCSKSG